MREAQEHLGSLQQGLLTLERTPADRELIHELLRNAHTLKGTSRMLGLEGIGSIAHCMEDLLNEAEEHGGIDAGKIDRLLAGSDAIGLLVAALAMGKEPQVNVPAVLAILAGQEPPP